MSKMNNRPSVLVLHPFPLSRWAFDALHAQCSVFGLEHHYQPTDSSLGLSAILSADFYPGMSQSVIGIVSMITDLLNAEALQAIKVRFPNISLICQYGVGINNIDIAMATQLGITLTNTPGILAQATADLTWALLLDACRRVSESDRLLRANKGFGGWAPFYHLGAQVSGKTLGIVGFGEIGQAVAKRAQGFDMRVVVTSRRPLDATLCNTLNVTSCDFDTLLSQSDIISLHCPLTPQTRHLFNATTLATMKQGSVLINTARGPIVDEAALVQALTTGPLMAAGLDVFEDEPAIHNGLLTLPNVVLSGHIGSATQATRIQMGDWVVTNILAHQQGKPVLSPVILN
jgi:glyoxylate reductase